MRLKRFSVIVAVLVFASSVMVSSAFAATGDADALAGVLKNGWYTSSTGGNGSWYAVALYWLRSISTDLTAIKTASADIKTSVTSIKSNSDSIKSDVSSVKTSASTIATNSGTISSNVLNLKSDVASIKSYSSAMETDVDIIRSHTANLPLIEADTSSIGTYISTIDSRQLSIFNRLGDLLVQASNVNQELDTHTVYLRNIDLNLAALKDFFDNPSHRALEEASETSVDAATSIYTSSSGGMTTSQKMGALGDFSGSISDNLDTGVAASQLFDIFSSGSDGDGGSIFGFFSRDAMLDMDPSSGGQRAYKKTAGGGIDHSQDIVTNYFGYNSSVFDNFLGSDHK